MTRCVTLALALATGCAPRQYIRADSSDATLTRSGLAWALHRDSNCYRLAAQNANIEWSQTTCPLAGFHQADQIPGITDVLSVQTSRSWTLSLLRHGEARLLRGHSLYGGWQMLDVDFDVDDGSTRLMADGMAFTLWWESRGQRCSREVGFAPEGLYWEGDERCDDSLKEPASASPADETTCVSLWRDQTTFKACEQARPGWLRLTSEPPGSPATAMEVPGVVLSHHSETGGILLRDGRRLFSWGGNQCQSTVVPKGHELLAHDFVRGCPSLLLSDRRGRPYLLDLWEPVSADEGTILRFD